ncbi:MAG: LamG-like jellyroll fold domain-containing protein [Candidatus Anstonellales archaeon]
MISFSFQPFANAIDIIPVEPANDKVFNLTNNLTFTCNATDDGQVLNLSLYHSLNGTFSLNQTQNYGELPFDSGTSFLCRFNGNLICHGGGNGNPVANDSVSFQDGKFSQGVYINETGILRYQTAGNFDRNQGTIEFWIRPGSDMTSYIWYIFQAAENEEDENQMQIYVSGGTLRFEIHDKHGYSYRAVADVSFWQIGQWYYVAAVWDLDSNVTDDGDLMMVYVNGSNENAYYDCDYNCDPPISYIYSSPSFSVGSDKYNQSQINSTIDDFRISNVVRNSSEINQSYYEGIANHSYVSKSWTFHSVPDGLYHWKCVGYDNDSQENSSELRSLWVDMGTPPYVSSIFLSPNSSDDIDPGVLINFTANITDPSGVDTVIFQWKKAGDWNNITMVYNSTSGLYENASIQADWIGGNYYYRVFSNDTGGNSGYSVTQNITVSWDFSWTRSPASFGTVSGLINSVGSLGTLTIDNTGDDTLNFTLSHNWPLPVYFNGSESGNFYVDSHKAITINLSLQFASLDSENDMVIIINASHPTETPSPTYLTTNATINSYSGGPYLSVSITEYNSMVFQSQIFNISVRVKNIGNETAEDVWLNLTLPTGWENLSGNIDYFAGNLSSGSYVISNLTVYVNPSSASPGTFIIYANSSCSQNVSGHDSKIVGVGCSDSDGICGYACSYVNDDDCGIPSGGGTRETVYVGGGGSEPYQYGMGVKVDPVFDINREERKSIFIKVTNAGKRSELNNIYLVVSGYPLTHITITPASIGRLEQNRTGIFEVGFFAPSYIRYGIHNITISVIGTGSSNFTANLTRIEKTVYVSMVVHSVMENETRKTITMAETAVQEMADAGLNVKGVSYLLEEAKNKLSQWDYDSALEAAKKILEVRERAFRIMETIREVEGKINEAEMYGIKTQESRKMVELSKSALVREDYAKAEERAGNAITAYFIESRSLETLKFLHSYWWLLTFVTCSSSIAIYFAYRKSRAGRLKKRIDSLSNEEKAIRNLMGRLQKERYVERSISGIEFHKQMAEYEEKLAKLKRKKSRLIAKLVRCEKPSKVLEGFRKQEEYLKNEIKEVQKKYYEDGSITKSSYQKTVEELREELAEAIKNIEMVMEGRSPSKKGQAAFLCVFSVAFVFFAGAVFGETVEKQSAVEAIGKAEQIVKQVEQLGLPVRYLNDTLNEAKLLFSKELYRGAESLAKEVEKIRDRIMDIDRRIGELEEKIYEARLGGIDTSEPDGIFDEVLESFRNEEYEKTEELIEKALSKLEELESEASMKRTMQTLSWEWSVRVLRENFLLFSLLSGGFVSVAAVFVRHRKRRKLRKEIAKLKKEREHLRKMMEETQRKYFEQGSITKGEYESFISQYRKRMSSVERRLILMEKPKGKASET